MVYSVGGESRLSGGRDQSLPPGAAFFSLLPGNAGVSATALFYEYEGE
jgi:hypothetical protein